MREGSDHRQTLREDWGANANDPRLLDKCRAGSEPAWSRLYATCLPPLRTLAFRMGFAESEVQDICQEVLTALAREITTVRNVAAFVQTVCRRRCIDHIRRRRPEEPYDEGGNLEQPVPSAAVVRHEMETWVQSIQSEDKAEAGLEALHLLRDHLETTEEPCKSLLHQRYFDEQSYQDIAAAGKIPAPQVGVYIGRCIKRLAARLRGRADTWAALSELWTALR